MTSVDSGVETGNDSNDSSIVQHANLTSEQIGTVSSVLKATTSSQGEKDGIDSLRIEYSPLTVPVPIESFYKTYQPFFVHADDCSTAISSGSRKIRQFRRPHPVKCSSSKARLHDDRSSLENSLDERKMRVAALTNNIWLMKRLLNKGISPNNWNNSGQTPLHIASYRGYTEMVHLLLEYGADPNHSNNSGSTPLSLATLSSKQSVIAGLLYAGSDILHLDNSSTNPLQIAQRHLKMLQNYEGGDTLRTKKKVQNIVHMLLSYLQEQKNGGNKVESLSTLCSRLSLSNTSDLVQDDVKDLLANLEALTITS